MVMPLSDAHALVAQENRDPLDRHAGKQELHRERVAEPMRDCRTATLIEDLHQVYKQLTTFLRFTNELD